MPHIIEIAILLLIAFLIGCVIGYFVRNRLFSGDGNSSTTEEQTAAGSAVSNPSASVKSQSAKEPVSQASKASSATPEQTGSVPAPSKAKSAKTAKPKSTAAKSKPAAAKSKSKAEKATKAPASTTKKSAARAKPVASAAPKTRAKTKTAVATKPADSAEGKPPTLNAPRAGGKDDLKRIGGIGPKIEGTLNNLGVYHFDQIAAWDRQSITWVDDYLSFKGRIDREAWVDQAKKLASES